MTKTRKPPRPRLDPSKMRKLCKNCGKTIRRAFYERTGKYGNREKFEKQKFCSNKCKGQAKKGMNSHFSYKRLRFGLMFKYLMAPYAVNYLFSRYENKKVSARTFSHADFCISCFKGVGMSEKTEKVLRAVAALEVHGVKVADMPGLCKILADYQPHYIRNLMKQHRKSMVNIKASLFEVLFDELEKSHFSMCEVLLTQMPIALEVNMCRMRGDQWYDPEKKEYKDVTRDMGAACDAWIKLHDSIIVARRKSGLSKPVEEHSEKLKHLLPVDAADNALIQEARKQEE